MLNFQTYFKYRFSQRGMVVGGTCSRPMYLNLVDSAICNGRSPTGCPLIYQVCFPHHLIEYIKYAFPHQWVFPSCPIVCRGLRCTKSLPCPLHNKFFAILYKSIGNFPLLTCFTNIIVGTACFALWQYFIIRHRSVNFQ